jgi:radical SAM-linked protein
MDFSRILLRFSKEGEARFLSHHDLMRLFERALRRADLPVRMTQGFNPHPRMSILLALPLGVEALDEPVELAFEPQVSPEEVAARLSRQMPPGIRIRSAEALPDGVRPRPAAVSYEVKWPAAGAVDMRIVEQFLARDAAPVERTSPKGVRTVDVRPAVVSMTLEGGTLAFELRIEQTGTPKPTEVLKALLGRERVDESSFAIRRTEVRLAPFGKRPHATDDSHKDDR